jgi:hypothetical protein
MVPRHHVCPAQPIIGPSRHWIVWRPVHVVICLTDHAERELRRRAIEPDWVRAAIAAPDRTEADPRDPSLTRSFKAVAAFGNRVLRVVHRPDGDDILVVTAHFDRGARR